MFKQLSPHLVQNQHGFIIDSFQPLLTCKHAERHSGQSCNDNVKSQACDTQWPGDIVTGVVPKALLNPETVDPIDVPLC